MKPFNIALLVVSLTTIVPCDQLFAADESLAQAVASDTRSAGFVARDGARHPQEVLEFFGLRPDMSVAEIWPSSGWWSEILAPYLKAHGTYYAVSFSLSAKRTPQYRRDLANGLIKKFAASPEQYDKAVITSLGVPEDTEIAPPGSVDMVLTFRNVHNWIKGGYADGVFAAMFRALKPGGTLGLVEHRAADDATPEFMQRSGYVSEAYVIALARAAGFKLQAKSEINANPKDDKNHPTGVWSLPPSLRYCRGIKDEAEATACKQKYMAIGESDRMTLKFIKPASQP